MRKEDIVLNEVLKELSFTERIIVKIFRKLFNKLINKIRLIIINSFIG